MGVRFIHAADLHIDSPLIGLSAYEGAPLHLLRGATREALRRLVDGAIREEVRFVVIAGDVYDGAWKDYSTGLWFSSEMARLGATGIDVYLLHGNHDAESEITKTLVLPPNVHVFSSRRADTFRIDDLKVALHGRSFRTAATFDNLVQSYPAPVEGWFNIGVLHTALEGNVNHARYAPCSLAELVARGYDYWALGHVHEAAVLSERPGIAYPGNLQGRHIKETGPRGALLVSVDDRTVALSPMYVDVLRWHMLDVDVSTANTFDEVVGAGRDALRCAVDQHADGRPLAVRVRFLGKTAAHGDLFGREPHLRAQMLAAAVNLGAEVVWVEKVVIKTTPVDDEAAILARADALSELQRFISKAAADPTFLATLNEELREVARRAPAELSSERYLPVLEEIRKGELQGLLAEVVPSLMARLTVTETSE